MELAQRTNTTILHNTITNIVGLILKSRPNEPMSAATMHRIVVSQYSDRYTVGQVRKGLQWQAECNSGLVKAKLDGFNNKTRVYWYEPASDI
jgi:hypothetical protein